MSKTFQNVAGEHIAGLDRAQAVSAREDNLRIIAQLITVDDVAKLIGASTRHVRRLSDAGKMPPPVRLGALVRWNRRVVLEWIAAGCRPVRTIGGRVTR